MAGPVQVNFTNKMAFIVGVVNSSNYGWAIAKSLAKLSAAIIIGTWSTVLKVFQMGLKQGSFDDDFVLPGSGNMEIAKVRQENGTHSWVLLILTRMNVHSCIFLNTGLPT